VLEGIRGIQRGENKYESRMVQEAPVIAEYELYVCMSWQPEISPSSKELGMFVSICQEHERF
jgi:hypothetical protein